MFDLALLSRGSTTPNRHYQNHADSQDHGHDDREAASGVESDRGQIDLEPNSGSAPIARRATRLAYKQPEREFLDHVRDVVVDDVERERDVFLCHAWPDRSGPATELFDALSSLHVDVWFSERDVILGKSLTRQLDAGLRVSRVGIVLVTPNMLIALRNGGFADQELGALWRPIV